MLTPRQNAVLRAVEALTAERGFPPTTAEVAQSVGVSRQRAAVILLALQRHKKIHRDANKYRSLVVAK